MVKEPARATTPEVIAPEPPLCSMSRRLLAGERLRVLEHVLERGLARITGTVGPVRCGHVPDTGAERHYGHGIGGQFRLPPCDPAHAGHYAWLRLHGHGGR